MLCYGHLSDLAAVSENGSAIARAVPLKRPLKRANIDYGVALACGAMTASEDRLLALATARLVSTQHAAGAASEAGRRNRATDRASCRASGATLGARLLNIARVCSEEANTPEKALATADLVRDTRLTGS
jgi:hypothetical protein